MWVIGGWVVGSWWSWAELGDDGGWWWIGMGAGQFWNGHLVAVVGIGDRVELCCGGGRIVVDSWSWGRLNGGRGDVVGNRWCELVLPMWRL